MLSSRRYAVSLFKMQQAKRSRVWFWSDKLAGTGLRELELMNLRRCWRLTNHRAFCYFITMRRASAGLPLVSIAEPLRNKQRILSGR
jgi:hypothetical protein